MLWALKLHFWCVFSSWSCCHLVFHIHHQAIFHWENRSRHRRSGRVATRVRSTKTERRLLALNIPDWKYPPVEWVHGSQHSFGFAQSTLLRMERWWNAEFPSLASLGRGQPNERNFKWQTLKARQDSEGTFRDSEGTFRYSEQESKRSVQVSSLLTHLMYLGKPKKTPFSKNIFPTSSVPVVP